LGVKDYIITTHNCKATSATRFMKDYFLRCPLSWYLLISMDFPLLKNYLCYPLIFHHINF